jgi:hypothetical protein
MHPSPLWLPGACVPALQVLRLLQNFLVAATMKDCSILIAFSVVDADTEGGDEGDAADAGDADLEPVDCAVTAHHPFQGRNRGVLRGADLPLLAPHTGGGTGFEVDYSVHVVDIDAKSVFNIPNYHRMEDEVVQCFTRYPRTHVCQPW